MTRFEIAAAAAVAAAGAAYALNGDESRRAELLELPCRVTTWAALVVVLALYLGLRFLVNNWTTLFGKVEMRYDLHGGMLVAKVLKSHGVKFVFTLIGGHISPILVASRDEGIRVVDVRMEANAVFAADAVARLTGVPGVAAVTAGPGLTNTITALKNAQMAESPLILLGGAAATLAKGRGALQDIDQMAVLRPLCKYSATCTSVRDIVPIMRKAFQEAMSGTPGPVFVEFPIDVLYPVLEVKANLGLLKRLRKEQVVNDEQKAAIVIPDENKGMTVDQYLATRGEDQGVFLDVPTRFPFYVKAFLDFSIRRLYAGAHEGSPNVSPLKVNIPMPSDSQLATALGLLLSAKNPVVLVASQATLNPKNCELLAEALTELGLPCFLGGMARGLLGRDSPFHIRQNRRVALKQADVVLLVGSYCDFRLDYGRVFPRRCKIVAINRSQFHLKRNTDLFWKPTLAAQADPAIFMLQLAKMVKASPRFTEKRAGWVAFAAQLKEAEAAKEASNAKKAEQVALGRVEEVDGVATRKRLLNPLKLVGELEKVLGEKSILIGDGGDFIGTAAYVLRPRGPLTWLDPGAFGTLGVGGGFALGAKLCKPDHDVWLLWGDGSVGYSVAEFDTFKRHNVPIVALVGNDACWTQIEREQVPMFGTDLACPLLYTEYDQIAKYYGGAGVHVSDPSADLKQILSDAQQTARDGTAVCVNALIGKSDFRKGSLSV